MKNWLNPFKILYDHCYRLADAIVSRYDIRHLTKYIMEDVKKLSDDDIAIKLDPATGEMLITLKGTTLDAVQDIADKRGLLDKGSIGLGEAFIKAIGTYMFFVENEGNITRSYTSKPNGPFGIGRETRDFIVP